MPRRIVTSSTTAAAKRRTQRSHAGRPCVMERPGFIVRPSSSTRTFCFPGRLPKGRDVPRVQSGHPNGLSTNQRILPNGCLFQQKEEKQVCSAPAKTAKIFSRHDALELAVVGHERVRDGRLHLIPKTFRSRRHFCYNTPTGAPRSRSPGWFAALLPRGRNGWEGGSGRQTLPVTIKRSCHVR
jgi:hypothetical protein